MLILGIDTSNYTTSCALFDSEKRTVAQRKRLLPVKAGEKGLRQSDSVFTTRCSSRISWRSSLTARAI